MTFISHVACGTYLRLFIAVGRRGCLAAVVSSLVQLRPSKSLWHSEAMTETPDRLPCHAKTRSIAKQHKNTCMHV